MGGTFSTTNLREVFHNRPSKIGSKLKEGACFGLGDAGVVVSVNRSAEGMLATVTQGCVRWRGLALGYPISPLQGFGSGSLGDAGWERAAICPKP